MRNLLRERAIELDLADGRQRLEQTVSASGVRYASADQTLVFWTTGNTARLERRGTAPAACSERRAATLREDARLRGVVYRALAPDAVPAITVSGVPSRSMRGNVAAGRCAHDGSVSSCPRGNATHVWTPCARRRCVVPGRTAPEAGWIADPILIWAGPRTRPPRATHPHRGACRRA